VGRGEKGKDGQTLQQSASHIESTRYAHGELDSV